MDIVTDPWFYAVAIPGVLLIGMAKSGFASGFGSLATPLMAIAVTVPQAAGIMLPVLLAADLAGVRRLYRERDPVLIRLFLPAGLIGVAVGTLLFGVLQAKTVAGVVGALTLVFLAQRLLVPVRTNAAPPPRWLGFVLAAASGFTSFVAHAGSPPISAYVLPLRLSPIVYAGTMATFFGAVNLAKVVPYAWLGLLDARNLATSLVLMPLAPLGVWIGVKLVGRVSPAWFYRLAYAGMLLTGLKLLVDGLR